MYQGPRGEIALYLDVFILSPKIYLLLYEQEEHALVRTELKYIVFYFPFGKKGKREICKAGNSHVLLSFLGRSTFKWRLVS